MVVFTSRPGKIKEDIKIDLPRPRSLTVKRAPHFSEYADHIWKLIEGEVRRSMGLDPDLDPDPYPN